jgi:hypothetical protein
MELEDLAPIIGWAKEKPTEVIELVPTPVTDWFDCHGSTITKRPIWVFIGDT